MHKYHTLIQVLDRICVDAPARYVSYHPILTDIQKVDQARAKAYIHLFLKVRFGLLDFEEREKYICEGSNDGGIDAYFIDRGTRNIFFIQSKFRTTESNFDNKNIGVDEILKMDVDRITEGNARDESGNLYNSKIQALIREIQRIEDIARYDFVVVLLANLDAIPKSKLKKLVGDFPVEVVDNSKCYNELVFPVISGTYYNSKTLIIDIDLYKKEQAKARIEYTVETEDFECEITLMFVPTVEIAKMLYKYKNSILKFNPRSYLTLSTNSVNKDIANTITNKKGNEFALFNNGITMLSDDTRFSDKTGRPYRGQLHITNPQIINGGQTAYTLSQVYEQSLLDSNTDVMFKNKEVMLKVITFYDESYNHEKKLRLVEAISKATNWQTSVVEADRRSNDKIQLELQNHLYNDYGYFYQRKVGEFFDGLHNKYISNEFVIDREILLRVAFAISGKPETARRTSAKILFSKESFDSVNKVFQDYRRLFFGYKCYQYLDQLQKESTKDTNNKFGVINYGNALRFGKLGVLYVANSKFPLNLSAESVERKSMEIIDNILSKWLDFEEFAKSQPKNREYFRKSVDPNTGMETLETDFDSYYKVSYMTVDLANYFKLKNSFL